MMDNNELERTQSVRNARSALLVLILALLSSGCSLPQSRDAGTDRSAKIPDTQQLAATGSEKPSAKPQPPSAQISGDADLRELRLLALTKNPGLQALERIYAAKRQRAPQVTALTNPRFSFTEYLVEVETRVGPQERGYSLQQSFPWFGKLRLRGSIAEEEALAAYQHLVSARLALDYELRTAYADYYYLGKSLAITRQNRSLLDSVLQDLSRLRKKLGTGDDRRVNEYLDSIRDVERRIQRSEEQGMTSLDIPDRPVGVPDTFEEHCRVMYDLQALAFQADITRVTTFMLGREVSQRTFPALGVPDAHHAISHHQDDPEKQAKVAKVDQHYAGLFAEYLEKLRATPDGDGNLLDHSMILYGACISEAQRHLHSDLPLVLAGGGAGQLRGDRHLQFGNVSMGNLLVSLAGKMGVPVEAIGESTGSLDELSGV